MLPATERWTTQTDIAVSVNRRWPCAPTQLWFVWQSWVLESSIHSRDQCFSSGNSETAVTAVSESVVDSGLHFLTVIHFCYLHQGGYVIVVLSVCWQLCTETSKRICMKFSGKVANGPVNMWLNFGGDLDHHLDTRIVFRIRHCWEIRKVVNRHSFILIRQMAALVRCALAEVCIVPVLLVIYMTVDGLVYFCAVDDYSEGFLWNVLVKWRW